MAFRVTNLREKVGDTVEVGDTSRRRSDAKPREWIDAKMELLYGRAEDRRQKDPHRAPDP
jgi:hypothetical protein